MFISEIGTTYIKAIGEAAFTTYGAGEFIGSSFYQLKYGKVQEVFSISTYTGADEINVNQIDKNNINISAKYRGQLYNQDFTLDKLIINAYAEDVPHIGRLVFVEQADEFLIYALIVYEEFSDIQQVGILVK